MLSALERKGAASPAKVQAAPYVTNFPTTEDWEPDVSAGDERLSSLQRQFQPFGLSIHRMGGAELAISGVGFAKSVPDARCAWLLLRQLRGLA